MVESEDLMKLVELSVSLRHMQFTGAVQVVISQQNSKTKAWSEHSKSNVLSGDADFKAVRMEYWFEKKQ
jgi:hypothetical protein